MPNLTSDQHELAIVQNGEIPESVPCKGDSDAIYRGSILTWSVADDKWVASQASSSSTPLVYGGIVDAGSVLAAENLTMYSDFTLEGKTIGGRYNGSLIGVSLPEVGATVYLKSRGTGGDISDNSYVNTWTHTSLTGTHAPNGATPCVVTGTGTLYTTELAVGDLFYMDSDGFEDALVVSVITSDTSITLSGAALGVGTGTAATKVNTSSASSVALTVGTSCTFTNGSTAVLGNGTAFLTELNVGDYIYGLTDGIAYAQRIYSIADNTNLVLEQNYLGTGGADTGAYGIFESDLTIIPTELYGTTSFYNVAVGKIEGGTQSTGWDIHFQRGLAAEGTSTFVDIAVSNDLSVGNDINVTNDVTVSAGDVTVTAGDIDVTAGDIDVATGDVNVAGAVDVVGNVESDASVLADDIDAITGTTLDIGGTTATAITVGVAGRMTTIEGTLNVDQAVTLDTSLSVEGLTELDQVTVDTDDGDFVVDGDNSAHLMSNNDAADAIVLEADGGTSAKIVINNTLSDQADAIDIDAAAGSITIDAKKNFSIDSEETSNITVTGASQDLDLEATGGSINLTSTEDDAQAIYIHSNGGTSDGIHISADQGEGDDSINIDSVAGGIDIDAAKSIALTSSEAQTDAIQIDASDTGGGVQVIVGTDAQFNIVRNAADKIQIAQNAGDELLIGTSGETARMDGVLECDEAFIANDTLDVVGKATFTGEADFSKSRFRIFEDFQMNTLGTSHRFTLSNDGGGGASPAITQAARGVCRLNTTGGGGANGSQLCIFTPVQLDDTGSCFIEAKVKINTAITGCSVNFGLTDNDAYEEPFTITGGGAPVATATDAVCFVYDDGATLKEWHAAAVDTGALDAGNGQLTTPTAPVADTYQVLRIDVPADGETGINFSIDGTIVHTLTGSTGVGDNVPLYGVLIIQESAAAAKVADLDYIDLEYTR